MKTKQDLIDFLYSNGKARVTRFKKSVLELNGFLAEMDLEGNLKGGL